MYFSCIPSGPIENVYFKLLMASKNDNYSAIRYIVLALVQILAKWSAKQVFNIHTRISTRFSIKHMAWNLNGSSRLPNKPPEGSC